MTIVRPALATGLLALFLAALGGIPHAYCFGWEPKYPRDYYSVRKEFARSKLVIEGRVDRVQWLDERGRPTRLRPPFTAGSPIPLGLDPYSGAYYDLAVLRRFKGPPVAHIRIFSENSSGRTPLSRGRRYLLFVTRQREDQRDAGQPDFGWQNFVDNCGNSASLPAGRTFLRQVERLAARPKTNVDNITSHR